MRVIVVGGKGAIGSKVVKELSERHDVLIAGRRGGDLKFDMSSEESIHTMFKKAGKFDAVVVAAGELVFEPLAQMTVEKYQKGITHKLLGQVSLVLVGKEFIQEGGSFTLTSGILSHDPIKAGSSAAMVNSAIEGFVRAAAIELTRGLRINAVSPSVLEEVMDAYGPFFPGFIPVPGAKVAKAYSKSVEGHQTGQVYTVW